MKKTARIAASVLALVLAGGSVISVPEIIPETVVYADEAGDTAQAETTEEAPAAEQPAAETETQAAPAAVDPVNTDTQPSMPGVTVKSVYGKIAPPSDVVAVPSTDSVSLKWTPVSGAAAYRIYQYDKVSGKFIKIKSVTSNSAVIKNLQTDETYYFKVAALSKEGKRYVLGGVSEKVKAKTGVVTQSELTNDYSGLTYKKGRTYYYKNGEYMTGLQLVGEYYYYFHPDTNYAAMKEWVQIGDEYYYFTETGRAATGTKKIDGQRYSFDRTGKCVNYEQVTKKTIKDNSEGESDENKETVKPPELPDPKDAGLSGSSTKCSITVNCGPKDKKNGEQAKQDVSHAFQAYRFKIVNKYGTGSIKCTTSRSDVNKFDAYYDIYYKGTKVYSYHEYWELTPNKYCKGNIEITKS